MGKLVECIMNLFDPMDIEEKRLQRNWERRLFIIQKK